MLVKELLAKLTKLVAENPEAAEYIVRYEYDAGWSFPEVGSVGVHEGRRGTPGPFFALFE